MRTYIFSILFIFAGGLAAQNFSITNYTTANSSIASNNVTAVKADASGNLWVGTGGSGLSKFNGTTWTTYTTTQGLVGNTVKAIDVDGSGNIWIATSAGLSKYNGSTFTNYTTAQGLASNDLRSVYVDNADNVWAGTAGAGVSKYNGVSFTTYNTVSGLVQNFVLAITQDLSGNMWFGTAAGVSKFTGTVWTTYTSINGINTNGDQVQSATTDAAGNVWMGSLPSMGIGGGLYKWNGATWTAYSTSDGLAHNDVRGIASDAKSRLWVATNGNGTSHFRNAAFTTYGTSAGMVSATQTCATVDFNGYVWIGTGSGLSRLQTVVYNGSTILPAHCGNNDGSITLNVGTINGPVYYSYDLGVTTTTSNTFSNLTAGPYQILFSDSSFYYAIALEVLASNDAMPAISANNMNICSGDSVQLGVDAGFTNCLWSPDSIVSSSTVPDPFISPEQNMWVYLTYTDTNGCVAEDSIQFFVMPTPNIYVSIANDSVFTSDIIFTYYQWYWYGDTIPGATGQSYTATQPGIYTLCAHNTGQCTGCSEMIHYMNAGIGEDSEWAHVFAENGNLHWNLPEENCMISIYSADGRVLQQFTATENDGQITFNNLVSGIVLIHVQRAESDAWVKVFSR